MPKNDKVERLVPDKARWRCEKGHTTETDVKDNRLRAPACEQCAIENMPGHVYYATQGQLLYRAEQVDPVPVQDNLDMVRRLVEALSPLRAGGGVINEWCHVCERAPHFGPRACKCPCHEARVLLGQVSKAA